MGRFTAKDVGKLVYLSDAPGVKHYIEMVYTAGNLVDLVDINGNKKLAIHDSHITDAEGDNPEDSNLLDPWYQVGSYVRVSGADPDPNYAGYMGLIEVVNPDGLRIFDSHQILFQEGPLSGSSVGGFKREDLTPVINPVLSCQQDYKRGDRVQMLNTSMKVQGKQYNLEGMRGKLPSGVQSKRNFAGISEVGYDIDLDDLVGGVKQIQAHHEEFIVLTPHQGDVVTFEHDGHKVTGVLTKIYDDYTPYGTKQVGDVMISKYNWIEKIPIEQMIKIQPIKAAPGTEVTFQFGNLKGFSGVVIKKSSSGNLMVKLNVDKKVVEIHPGLLTLGKSIEKGDMVTVTDGKYKGKTYRVTKRQESASGGVQYFLESINLIHNVTGEGFPVGWFDEADLERAVDQSQGGKMNDSIMAVIKGSLEAIEVDDGLEVI